MFNQFYKHFAYQTHGADWEGWTPPWEQHGKRPHFFGMHRGHGPFGPEGPFGPRGPFGPEGPLGPKGERRRFFGRGDVKFALLALLQERPMHGYEMMKALEEKSGGFYAPSAGSVYPTLQMLQDRGLVTVNEIEGKKVYSITDAGRALLAERHGSEEECDGPFRGWGHSFGPKDIHTLKALKGEVIEVARLFATAGRMSFHNPEQLAQLRGILERTRKELSDMLYRNEPESPHLSK